jgi:hypothetical protein
MEREVKLHTFLASALDRSERLALMLGHLKPR